MATVGIPQSLFYYYYFPLWKTFFEYLGAEVITSMPTSKALVDKGISLSVDENCFPLKVFYGHVESLVNQGVDYVFIPRLISIESKNYICPKFMGIPDMIRAGISPLPTLIAPTIDLSKNDLKLDQEILYCGKFFASNQNKIKTAFLKGLQELKAFQVLTKRGYTCSEAINLWNKKQFLSSEAYEAAAPVPTLTIGVLGHGYSLYDHLISMDLINKLRKLNCQVLLAESLSRSTINQYAATLPKQIFWTLGHKMIGSALYFDHCANVDGIIYLACFGCGPDSLVGEMIERKVAHKPFMLLTIDEHTGENGMNTRLEAFYDMLIHRKQRRVADENYFSTSG